MLRALMQNTSCGIFVRCYLHRGLTECLRKLWSDDDNE